MTHNEDKNQLIESDPEITATIIMFCMFKKVEERDMGDPEKTQLKFLSMKTVMSKIKKIYTLDGIDTRLDITEEEISEFEEKAIEIIPNETERGKTKQRGKMNRVSLNLGTTSNAQIGMYLESPQNKLGWIIQEIYLRK